MISLLHSFASTLLSILSNSTFSHCLSLFSYYKYRLHRFMYVLFLITSSPFAYPKSKLKFVKFVKFFTHSPTAIVPSFSIEFPLTPIVHFANQKGDGHASETHVARNVFVVAQVCSRTLTRTLVTACTYVYPSFTSYPHYSSFHIQDSIILEIPL